MTRAALAVTGFALLALAPVAAASLGNAWLLSLATRTTIYAIAAVSLQLVVGYGGLVSLGHAAFLGIGAYAVPVFGAADGAISMLGALLAGALFALGTGWVALRTRGVTLIMITLAFAQMAYFVAQSLDVFGGSDGMPVDPPALFGTALLRDRVGLHALALALLLALTLAAGILGRSRLGRVLRAARESERRVIAAGLDAHRARLITYALAGAIAAVAGWLLAAHAGFVSPALMEWRVSGELLVMVILGGATAPEGAALGAIALTLGETALAGVTEHWRMILGPLIVLLALARHWHRRPA